VVPDKGYDAVLFGAMAVVVAVLLQGKYSALWTLVAGKSYPPVVRGVILSEAGSVRQCSQAACLQLLLTVCVGVYDRCTTPADLQVGQYSVWHSCGTQGHWVTALQSGWALSLPTSFCTSSCRLCWWTLLFALTSTSFARLA